MIDDAPSPLLGALLDGKYRIRKQLGEGGVGAVYEAENVDIKKLVAIKVLHALYATSDEFRRRFEREARAASKLSHPACVSVLDFGRIETVDLPAANPWVGAPYLVLEFARGKLLADRMDDGPPIDPVEAIAVTRGVLSALKHAHGLDIVHRDVKPANIILRPSDDLTGPMVKLLDFGLAKELSPERAQDDTVTQTGMVFGTPGYLSPEQASGSAVDQRSDLYAVGVILFELICGRRPFIGEDPLETVRMHLREPPPSPRSIRPSISPALDAVILKALAKNPAERFQKAEEMSAVLAQVPEAAGLEISQPVVPTRQAARTSTSERVLSAIAVATSAILIVLGVVLPPQVSATADPFVAIASGQLDLAIEHARARLKDDRQDARARVALGVAYQKKLWCSDAISEFERAIANDRSSGSDPILLRSAIGCLSHKTLSKSQRLLVAIGAPALSELRDAAENHPSTEIQRAAAQTLAEIEKK